MSFKTYNNNLSASRTKIFCPECLEVMIPKEYLEHRQNAHEPTFDGRIQCGFCSNYRWKPRQKFKHSKHLLECFKSFIRNYDIQNLKTVDQESVADDIDFPCECESFMPNHHWIPKEFQEPDVGRAYEPIDLGDVPEWLRIQETLEDIFNAIRWSDRKPKEIFKYVSEDDDSSCFDDGGEDIDTFPDEEQPLPALSELSLERLLVLLNASVEFHEKTGMGEVAFWIRTYTRFAESLHFIHAVVRLGTFKSFEEKLLQNSDNVYLLPYWCL